MTDSRLSVYTENHKNNSKKEKLEENKSPKKNSQSVMVFSIIGMLCFIVAIVGFMVIIKRKQDEKDEKAIKNADCEKMPPKK